MTSVIPRETGGSRWLVDHQSDPTAGGNMKNSYLLLTVVQSYGPDGDAQAKAARIFNEMRGSGESEDKIVLAFAQILADGLQHGNWPWNG